jgi:hypothetical protein
VWGRSRGEREGEKEGGEGEEKVGEKRGGMREKEKR